MSPFLGLSLMKAQRPLSHPHIWPLIPQRASPEAEAPVGHQSPVAIVFALAFLILLRSVAVLNELASPDFTEATDPLALFKLWLQEAGATEINDPEAMTPATVDADGLARRADGAVQRGGSARPRLLHQHRQRQGPRTEESAAGGGALHWKSLRRQVRFGADLRSDQRRERRLFRLASERKPDRRLGERAITAARRAWRSRSGGGSVRTAVRERRRATTGLSARLSAGAVEIEFGAIAPRACMSGSALLARRRNRPGRSGSSIPERKERRGEPDVHGRGNRGGRRGRPPPIGRQCRLDRETRRGSASAQAAIRRNGRPGQFRSCGALSQAPGRA